jgi:hypothetical protein
MLTTLRVLAFLFLAIGLVTTLSIGDYATALGAAFMLGILLFAVPDRSKRESDDGIEHGVQPESWRTYAKRRLIQLTDVPLKQHALVFAFVAALVAISIWQYGGIDAGSLFVIAITAVYAPFLFLAYRWRSRRARSGE